MPTIIHSKHCVWAGFKPAHTTVQYVALFSSFCLLCSALFVVAGCSAGPSVDGLLAAANIHLADAQKAGAGQYARVEFDEATALLAEAEAAVENKDQSARVRVRNALARARLVEALTRQLKAESETTQLEAELEVIFSEADQARQEKQSAESELERMLSE